MTHQNSGPAWVKAFWDWFNKICSDFEGSDAEYDQAAAKAFASAMNWNMCDFCAGPCGDCPQKYSEEEYPCDPCPQDQFGITECTNCPYRLLRQLYRLRSEQDR